ncbi:MAG: hypothetical protein ACTSQF_07965 [Candidatus Heimdallarchaeaceae archaeon]
MSAWLVFLAIFGGFLVIIVIGYIIYYKNHNAAKETDPKQSPDELDNATEVTKRETLRQRIKQYLFRY